MSQPCGFLSDLLNCPHRHTYQTLVAPPMTCPMCNGGFADRETIEMVQGPWGCNQMIRSHIGGSYAVPGHWGNAPPVTSNWNHAALVSNSWGSCAMVPANGHEYDHRLGGPYGSVPVMCNGYNDGFVVEDGFVDGCGWDHGRSRRRGKHKSSHYREYYRSTRPATNCVVM